MACFRPLSAWKGHDGKMNFKGGPPSEMIKLPCGKCIGCLLERSRQWAVRCMHEAQMHKENCFLTLTYDDYHLPDNGSLDKRDFVLFMKRLRKRYGAGIRFFQCGEYGEKLQRPHHHCCLFGFDFPDKYPFSRSESGSILYRSESLEELWPYGFASIGELTYESAAYTARYVMKKLSDDHRMDEYTGLQPEYVTMSRRPGIGRSWYDKYHSDVFGSDQVILNNGFICKPPRYYENLLRDSDPWNYFWVKYARLCASKSMPEETVDRLMIRERSLKLKSKRLKRNLESQDSLIKP